MSEKERDMLVVMERVELGELRMSEPVLEVIGSVGGLDLEL